MKGVCLSTICPYPTMDLVHVGTQHTPYWGVFWSSMDYVSSWVIACEQGTVILHVFKAPNLLPSFMLTYTTLPLAFLSSVLFPSTSASVIITSSIKYSGYEFWSGESQGPMLRLTCEEEHPPNSKSSEGPIDTLLQGGQLPRQADTQCLSAILHVDGVRKARGGEFWGYHSTFRLQGQV